MRVLVVGSLPPPISERSRGLLAEVLRLRATGAQVEILSPRPNTVAHHHIAAPGPAAALEIGLAGRRFDEIVLQLEPGFPFPPAAGRAGRTAGLGALSAVLKAIHRPVTVRLASVHDLPGGPGGRAAESLWAVARRIEAGDEATMHALAATLSPAAAQKLALAVAPLELKSGRPAGNLAGGADLEDATMLVRARAAEDRRIIVRGCGDSVAEVPLGEWLPRPGAGVPLPAQVQGPGHSPGPLGRRVGRVLLHAADGASLTRPIARSVRVARKVARRY